MWFVFICIFFFVLPYLYLTKSRKTQGMPEHNGLCFADSSRQFTGPQRCCSQPSFPQTIIFSHAWVVLKMNESSSLEQRLGSPGEPWLGSCWPPKMSWCVTARGFLAHTWSPQLCCRTIHQEGEKNPTISQEAAQDTSGKRPDLDHFLT